MNRRTGKPLEGFDHLVQSLEDLLTTPKLTRLWRRGYGGEGFYLMDKPGMPDTLIAFTIAIGDAVNKWEPRYRLHRVWFSSASQAGEFEISMDGVYYPNGHLGDFETGVKRGINLPLPTGFYVTGNV